MFIELDKKEILALEESFELEFVGLWDSLENAKNSFNGEKGFFTAYIESVENLVYDFKTKVKVFKFLNY